MTALVHFLLLRPLLDLEGADRLVDTLLHQAVPVLVILTWLAMTLLVRAATGWVPYPFLDAAARGWPAVAAACAAVLALFVLLAAAVGAVDRRLAPRP